MKVLPFTPKHLMSFPSQKYLYVPIILNYITAYQSGIWGQNYWWNMPRLDFLYILYNNILFIESMMIDTILIWQMTIHIQFQERCTGTCALYNPIITLWFSVVLSYHHPGISAIHNRIFSTTEGSTHCVLCWSKDTFQKYIILWNYNHWYQGTRELALLLHLLRSVKR